jgi:hypothetical protein
MRVILIRPQAKVYTGSQYRKNNTKQELSHFNLLRFKINGKGINLHFCHQRISYHKPCETGILHFHTTLARTKSIFFASPRLPDIA